MPKSLFPSASPDIRARLEDRESVRLINDFNWSATPLGAIPQWPESLKGAVRLIVTSSTPMVMMVGPEGRLIYNDAYAAFAAQRHPSIFGRPALEAWPEIADFNRHKIELGLGGETLILHDQELVLDRHGQPESVWMDLHYSPVLGEDGIPLAVTCIVHETTDRIMAERALLRSEERLSLALSGSSLVGTWDWDVANDVVTADDRFAALFALDPLRAGLGVPLSDFTRAIHADDRDRVAAEISAALASGEVYRSEYRVLDSDGAIRWVVATGRARLDANGKAVRFPGVVVDMTDQRQISDALRESEARFRTLADTMPQMVWATQPDGFHDYYNARWYEFTGVPAGSTDGEGWNDMFHPDDQQRAWRLWRHSLETGEPYQIEYRLKHHSGQYRWTLGLALPMRDNEGAIVRWFGTCTDIHDTRIAAEERELISQELSHRIKNLFAVITGIVSLSARNNPEYKPFADQLRERIYALGEAHDFVRSEGNEGEDRVPTIFNLTRRLLRAYETDAATTITFKGDDSPIDEGAITPIALLIHELATNSAKYGALSTARGTIGVTGNFNENRYRFVWRERGVPAIAGDAKIREGFGSRLMKLSVEGQMRGEFDRKWHKDGLEVVAVLPADLMRRPGTLEPSAQKA